MLPPANDRFFFRFQSPNTGKAKNAAKSPITKFFPSKTEAEATANGTGGGGSSSTPSKKRKAAGGGAGTPKSPGASGGFVSFCRANRARVSRPTVGPLARPA